MSPLGTEQPIRDVRSSVATEGVNRVWPNRLDSEAIDRSGHPTLFWRGQQRTIKGQRGEVH
jgi:hypothetical protein